MAESFLDAHKVQELVALEGRAKVTFPYGETAWPRIERILKVDLQDLEAAFLTPDEEYPEALLIEQSALSQDSQYVKVFRAWEKFPGPWIPSARYDTALGPVQMQRRAVLADPANVGAETATGRTTFEPRGSSTVVAWEIVESWSSGAGTAEDPAFPLRQSRAAGKYGTFEETLRQTVPAGTNPEPGGPTASERVEATSSVLGERILRHTVDAGGDELTAGLIVTLPERFDHETGTAIFTDRFLAPLDYALPVLDYDSGAYTDWKTIAAGRVSYTATSYDPPRYPIDARKADVPESAYCLVEVDYCRIPSPQVRFKKVGFRFPALFDISRNFTLPENYAGKIKPPWPIGAESIYGYSFLAHRQNTQAAQVIRTFSLGRRGALPLSWSVQTPGSASKVFGGLIPEDCIHPPIVLYETIPVGTGSSTNLVEDIPASTPSSYRATDILIESADEDQWHGGIYVQTVVRVSEALPVASFPDPVTAGYYTVGKDFAIVPDALLTGSPIGQPVYVQTVSAAGGTGSESVGVFLTGADAAGEAGVSESVSASPTAAASATAYRALSQVRLAQPLASDTLQVLPAVEPDTAALGVVAFPADGDTLELGLAGSTRTYTFKATLDATPDEIQISTTTLSQQRDNIVAAIRATTYAGVAFSYGTAPHADVAARVDPAAARGLELATLSPTTNTAPSGLVLNTTGSWASAGAWITGTSSPPLVQITAGQTLAFAHTFPLHEAALLDPGAGAETAAAATLPGAPVLYTGWLQVPAGQPVVLLYNATGSRALRLWWQSSSTGSAPARVAATVSVTGGSTVIGPAFGSGDVGKPILSPGDPRENLLIDPTHLLNPYAGATGTVAASLSPLVATRLHDALQGQLRAVPIGTPAGPYVRLRIEQPDPVRARALAAQATWTIGPDD